MIHVTCKKVHAFKDFRLYKKLSIYAFMPVFLLLTLLSVSMAQESMPRVTLSAKDIKLEDVFAIVKKQTGYVFSYTDGTLKGKNSISIDVKNEPLDTFLKKVLQHANLDYSIKKRTIFIKPRQQASSRDTDVQESYATVTGTVSAVDGTPLGGVSIQIKEEDRSSTTDNNGSFRMSNIRAGQTLVFSYVGYESKETKVTYTDVQQANKNDEAHKLRISLLPKVNTLETTVVTAYGIEKSKKELGYGVAKVTGEEINRTAPGNILTGLTGKVSGLNISNLSPDMNNSSNVILRGLRSINETANNQPLIILNGSPLSFGSDQLAAGAVIDMLNSLNPSDVQDVTVLKGANGSALYGPEGVNGVIIINTKKGSAKKFDINFQTSSLWQRINFNRKRIQTEFGTGGFADENGKPVYDPVGYELWGPAYNGQSVVIGRPDENGEEQKVPYTYNRSRFDFWNAARLTQNNLSLAQNDEKGDFYLGLNYIDQTGLLPKDKQNRVNVLLNTGRNINSFTKIRLNILYDRNNANRGPRELRTDDIPGHIPVTSYKDFINNKWADRNHYWSDTSPNPYEVVANNRTQSNVNVLVGNLEARITPFSGVTLIERVGLNYSGSVEKATSEPLIYSEFARMNWRPISIVDKLASMQNSNQSLISLNNDLLLQVNKRFGGWGVQTTLGNSIRQMDMKQNRVNIAELAIPVFNPIYALNNNRGVQERNLLSRSISAFGTLMFDYQQKIYLELLGRQDWDSKLATIARDRNFYAGASTSIILSDLIEGLNNKSWMNMWKVRASVTTTANMNILPQQVARTLEAYSTIGTLPYFGYMRENPNKNIRPERIISQEYGTELSLFNNKVEFDFSYYRQRNNGLILSITSSAFSAVPTMDNAGVYNNYGMDMTLRLRDIVKSRGDFHLDATLLYANNNNKVISLPSSMNGQLLTYVSNSRLVARTGSYAYAFALNDFMRNDEGKIIVDRSTGLPMVDGGQDPVIKGRAIPIHTAGLNINMGWKKFTFGATMEYRGGNHQYNESGFRDMRIGLLPVTTYNNREPFVVPNSVYMDDNGAYVNNTDIKVVSARDYFQAASYATVNFLSKADFFRLNELYLGYDFNLKNKHLKKLGVKVFGRDLVNIYTKDNVNGDPLSVRGPGWNRSDLEQIGGYDSNSGGSVATAARLPGTSMYGFSVNINF